MGRANDPLAVTRHSNCVLGFRTLRVCHSSPRHPIVRVHQHSDNHDRRAHQ
ncbi:hypothetical protein ACSBOB_06605 [Mesorhizobium sp. ASY16-5R]|uniref:hypothetical protein n=1 Tax=Mesorhizobium sp. ASY16-5R TaxID=3445772 RepID=UPI003FA0EA17